MTYAPLEYFLYAFGGMGQHRLEWNAWSEMAVLVQGGYTVGEEGGDQDAIVGMLAVCACVCVDIGRVD